MKTLYLVIEPANVAAPDLGIKQRATCEDEMGARVENVCTGGPRHDKRAETCIMISRAICCEHIALSCA